MSYTSPEVTGSVTLATSVTVSNFPVVQPVTGSVGLVGLLTGAFGLTGPITGTVGLSAPVAVSNFPVVQVISASLWVPTVTGSVVLASPSEVSQGSPSSSTSGSGAWWVRPYRPRHYSALFRLLTRPYALSKALGTSSRTQLAVIQHAAASLLDVQLRRASVFVESVSTATPHVFDLNFLFTAASGSNPAVSPRPYRNGPGAEASCLTLPTAGGVEGGATQALASAEFNVGATAAVPTTNPPPTLVEVPLFVSTGEGAELPTLRAGTLEGLAVVVDVALASTLRCFVRMEFSESMP